MYLNSKVPKYLFELVLNETDATKRTSNMLDLNIDKFFLHILQLYIWGNYRISPSRASYHSWGLNKTLLME